MENVIRVECPEITINVEKLIICNAIKEEDQKQQKDIVNIDCNAVVNKNAEKLLSDIDKIIRSEKLLY